MIVGSDDTFRIDWSLVSDDDLVALIKVNDSRSPSALIEIFRRACQEAYQRFHKSISRTIQAVLRPTIYCNRECWEDVSQQFWLKLPDIAKTYDRNHEVSDVKKSRAQVYFNEISRNLAYSHQRACKSLKELSLDAPKNNHDGRPGTVPVEDVVITILPLDELLALSQALELVKKKLTPIELIVFLLRVNKGLTQEEIREIVSREVPPPRYDDGHRHSQEYKALVESHPEYSQEQILAKLGIDLPLSFEYIAEVTSPTKQGKNRTPMGVKKLYYKIQQSLIESLKKQGFKS